MNILRVIFRINHSNNAIVKPPELTPQAAAKEMEDVMKRVREAQSTIAAAIDPGSSHSRRPQLVHISSFFVIVCVNLPLCLSSILRIAAYVDGRVFSRVFSLAYSGGKEALAQQIQETKTVPFQISIAFMFSLTTEKIPIQTRVSLKAFVLSNVNTASRVTMAHFTNLYDELR